MNNPELVSLLFKFGNDLVSKMIAIILANDKVYTGRLKNSFSVKVINTLTEISLEIKNSAPYAELIDQGGTLIIKPTYEDIRGWAKFRGIEMYTYPIFKHITAPEYRVQGIFFTEPLKRELSALSIRDDIQAYIVEYLLKEVKKANVTQG